MDWSPARPPQHRRNRATLNDSVHAPVQAVSQYVVVYDPTGSFVIGGGWINSPVGAPFRLSQCWPVKPLSVLSRITKKGRDHPGGSNRIQVPVRQSEFPEPGL